MKQKVTVLFLLLALAGFVKAEEPASWITGYEVDMGASSITLTFDRELNEEAATNCANYAYNNNGICSVVHQGIIRLSNDKKQITLIIYGGGYLEYSKVFNISVLFLTDTEDNELYNEVIEIVCPSVPVTEVANIAELRAKAYDFGFHKILGEVIVTDINETTICIQDETGAVSLSFFTLKEEGEKLNIGDKIKDIYGYMLAFYSSYQISVREPVTLVSTDNPLPTPLAVSLNNFSNAAYMESNTHKLIKLSGVSFTEADGEKVFENNKGYLITNGTDICNYFRTTSLGSADYIGQIIPSGKFDITGICTTFVTQDSPSGPVYSLYFITPRSSDDIQLVDDGGGDDNIAAEKVDALTVNISPNPTAGVLLIKGELEEAKVEVYSLSGALVGSYAATVSETTIDISHLSAGTYFVKIGETATKVIKQ